MKKIIIKILRPIRDALSKAIWHLTEKPEGKHVTPAGTVWQTPGSPVLVIKELPREVIGYRVRKKCNGMLPADIGCGFIDAAAITHVPKYTLLEQIDIIDDAELSSIRGELCEFIKGPAKKKKKKKPADDDFEIELIY